jgi:phenylacetate-CoA ligase
VDIAALAIRHVLYPLWEVKNRSRRLSIAAQLERSQYESIDVLRDRQWRALQRLVAHAYATCPFYRTRFDERGLKPADLRSLEDIRLLPTISKEDIQLHRDALVSSAYRREDLIPDMTGGSTGSPMQFYYDRHRLDSRVAATLRHNRWSGWELGDLCAVLWGAPQDLKVGRLAARVRDWILDRRILLDASRLNEQVMQHFAAELRRRQPKILQAYSNTLGLFARYVRDQGIGGIAPRGIVCSAEVLTDENRRLIEETFGCRVYNRYGCREFAVIASECDVHQGMHVNAENLLVEVLRDGEPCTGQDGEVVVTDLNNLAMPMLRYRIKDIGRLVAGTCSCGRGLPLMELSGGRSTDFLTAIGGSKVSGIVLATYVITRIPGVKQIQFVQNEPECVTMHVVKGPQWSSDSLAELTRRTHGYLGETMRIAVEFRDHIPAEKSGKFRFSISTL